MSWRIVASLLALAAASCSNADSPARKPFTTLAFYYPWYGAPTVSDGWVHWDSDGHDPDRTRADGNADISARYIPELGAYDSSDPAVIARHIEWSQKAGLDGWIISWWGLDSRENRVTEQIARDLEARGCPVRYTIYHEQVPPGGADGLVSEMQTFLARHGSNPCLLQRGGRPLIFVYYRSAVESLGVWQAAWPRLSDIELWADVDPVLVQATYPAASFFDGFHTYNPWPYLIEGGVERAVGVYKQYVPFLRERGKPFALTVLPGYDDTPLQRPFTWKLEREGGEAYRRFIRGALELKPEYLLITSFNEWHEGSSIEPGTEWGDLYLRLTKEETGN